MLRYQQSCIEDLLIYSLKHNMSTAIKECLCNLLHGNSHLSRACQVHLVMATLPAIEADESSAAQLLDSDLLLLYCGILRGFQFIRTNCLEAGGTESYCFATLSLKKIIAMHLICNEPNRKNVKMLLENLFHKDEAQKMVSSLQNVRLINVLKREIKKFQDLVEALLHDEDACLRFVQGAMWDEYGGAFWKKLQRDLQDYIHAVHSYLPAVNIETVLENIKADVTACGDGFLEMQSLLEQGSHVEERSVIALVKHLKQDEMAILVAEENTTLSNMCENQDRRDASSRVGHPTSNRAASQLTTGQFYMKKLSVCLSDIKKENVYASKTSSSLNKVTSKKRSLDKTPENSQNSKHILSLSVRTERLSKYTKWCAVEVADVLSDVALMKKYSPRGKDDDAANVLNYSSSSLDSLSSLEENKENSKEAQLGVMSKTSSPEKHNTRNARANSRCVNLLDISNRLQCSNVECHLANSTSSSNKKRRLRKTKSKIVAKAQACRKLSYVGNAQQNSASLVDETNAECCSDIYLDGFVSESDCSDSDGSEILELDGPCFPDFTRFQFTPTCYLSYPAVSLNRLKPQLEKRDSSIHYFIESCSLHAEDTFLILNET